MTITLQRGDLTQVATDAIVNAANSSLLGGGGVDGAIHRAGGPEILAECRAIRARQGKCAPGEAVLTTAGRMPARHVIHTVGPVWNGGKPAAGKPYPTKEENVLASAYRRSLEVALEHGLKTVAFPNISTGVYGFPKERAAPVAIETVRSFADSELEEVVFVCFDAENYELYERLLAEQ